MYFYMHTIGQQLAIIRRNNDECITKACIIVTRHEEAGLMYAQNLSTLLDFKLE